MQPPAESRTREREEFDRRGLVVIPALLDREEVALLGHWAQELAARDELPGGPWMYFDACASVTGGRQLSRVENFEPHHAGLAAMLRGAALAGTASRLLGEPALLFKDKINFKLPGGEGFEPHQDVQAGWETYASRFVTAAVAIDPADLSNGCLELARWSHRRERIGRLWEPLRPAELEGIAFEPLEMCAGDAVFFDGHLPHRSGPNASRSARRVLYVTYSGASDGDQRLRYYADKHRSYPPDCERDPGRVYAYRV